MLRKARVHSGLMGVGSVRFWLCGKLVEGGIGVEKIPAAGVGLGVWGEVIEGRRLWGQVPEEGWSQAGLAADEVEPTDDGSFGAVALAGDFGGA